LWTFLSKGYGIRRELISVHCPPLAVRNREQKNDNESLLEAYMRPLIADCQVFQNEYRDKTYPIYDSFAVVSTGLAIVLAQISLHTQSRTLCSKESVPTTVGSSSNGYFGSHT
jgi:hypothetical protein